MSVESRIRRGPGDRLRTALLELARDRAEILSHHEKSWASITFSGARHRVTMRFTSTEAIETGENFIAFLPEHEFAIPGQLVADADVTEVDHQLEPPVMVVTCELLLLEDG